MDARYAFVWLFARQHICSFKPLVSTGGNSSLELLNVLDNEKRRANEVGAAGLYIKGPNGQFNSPNLLT